MKPQLDQDVQVAAVSAPELADWFAEQATDGMTLFLAHADDGVIWGRVEDKQLLLAGSVFPAVAVELRPTTLRQARHLRAGRRAAPLARRR